MGIMKSIRIRSGVEEGRWLVRVLAGLALLAVGFAIYEWFSPSAPPFKGRWFWLFDGIFALASSAGFAFLWAMAAVALVVVARVVWRHTPRVPSDKWLC